MTSAATDSSLLYQTEKRGVKYKQENASRVYNTYVDKNVNKKANLIPANYRTVFWILLGDQKKFDIVMKKLIAKIDALEKPTKVKRESNR